MAPGIELAYMDRGSGQAIIFLTGWTFTKEVFEKQVGVLAKSYRVIAYDPRSQGASSFTLEGNDYLTHAQDLAILINALGIKNPILAGWSTGGLTAWAYIRQQGPTSIAGNITIDVMPKCVSTEQNAWVQGSFERIAGIHTIYLRDAAGQASFVRRYAETFMIEGDLAAAEINWIVNQSLRTKTLVASQLFASFMFSDHTAAAISIARTRPTLQVISQRWSDRAVPFIRQLLPESKFVVFGGNMMFWEYPDAFNAVIDEFIRLNVTPEPTPDEDGS